MNTSHNLEMYQNLYPFAEVINWDEIYCGKKFHKVRPEMLTEQGEAIPYMSKVKGDTATSTSFLRIVIFDRDYAVAKLSADLKLIVTSLDVHEWRSLMDEVHGCE